MLILFVVPAAFSNFYLPVTFAQTQGLVGLRMRAMASAFMLFILNIIGLGLGPYITGVVSDLFADRFGIDSMRYALLLVIGVVYPMAALHYFLASRSIEQDLSRVDER